MRKLNSYEPSSFWHPGRIRVLLVGTENSARARPIGLYGSGCAGRPGRLSKTANPIAMISAKPSISAEATAE